MKRKATEELVDLFAAVYANPHDDGPRSVLADALQEAGDPRGEFIALQLARGRGGKKTRREGQLLRPNLRKWIGPLVNIVPSKGMVFERGFLAKCFVPAHTELPAHPEWATVEEVTIDGRHWNDLQPLANVVPNLRVLGDVEFGRQLPAHPRLEEVSIRFVNDDHVDHMIALDAPALRGIDIEWCNAEIPAIERFLKSPFAKQLHTFCMNTTSREAEWIAMLIGCKLPSVGYTRQAECPFRLWFEGDRITAEYFWAYEAADGAESLSRYLKHVPNPERWHVTIAHDIEIPRGLAMTLKKFKSYAVEAG